MTRWRVSQASPLAASPLQIAVDDIEAVQLLQCAADLGNDARHMFFRWWCRCALQPLKQLQPSRNKP